MQTPWFFRDVRYVSLEDRDKREQEERAKQSQALAEQTYKRDNGGLFSKAIRAASGFAEATGGLAKEAFVDRPLSDIKTVYGGAKTGLQSGFAVASGQTQAERVPIEGTNQFYRKPPSFSEAFSSWKQAVTDPVEAFSSGPQAFEERMRDPKTNPVSRGLLSAVTAPETYAVAGAGGALGQGIRSAGLGRAGKVAAGLVEPIGSSNIGARVAGEIALNTGGQAGTEFIAQKTNNPVAQLAGGLAGGMLAGASIGLARNLRNGKRLLSQIDAPKNSAIESGGIVRTPEMDRLQSTIDELRKNIDEPVRFSGTPRYPEDILPQIQEAKAALERLGGVDRGFPSAFELRQIQKDIIASLPENEPMPDFVQKQLEDINDRLDNYERLKFLHEGVTTEAPLLSDIEAGNTSLQEEYLNIRNQIEHLDRSLAAIPIEERAKRAAIREQLQPLEARLYDLQSELNKVGDISSSSIDELRSIDDLSEIPDERLIRIIDSKQKSMQEIYWSSMDPAPDADRMRVIGELANYEAEAQKRGLNVVEELDKFRSNPYADYESTASQAQWDNFKVAETQYYNRMSDEQLRNAVKDFSDTFANSQADKISREVYTKTYKERFGTDPFAPTPQPVTKVSGPPTGLEHLDDSTLRSQMDRIASSGLPESDQRILRREYEREIANRGISGGAAPQTLVTPRTPTPGLSRSEKFSNYVTTAKKWLTGNGIRNDEVATPIANEYARINRTLDNHAERIQRTAQVLEREFNKPSLLENTLERRPGNAQLIEQIGNTTVSPVTIQDIAQNYSYYKPMLNEYQRNLFDSLRRQTEAFDETLRSFGVEVPKVDIQDPEGFYLPRGETTLGVEDLPELRPQAMPKGGATQGFEKPRKFPTQARGIKAGFEYPTFSEAMKSYGRDVSTRASETWLADQIKNLPNVPKGRRGSTGQVQLYQTSGLKGVTLPSEVSDVINRELNRVKGINRSAADQLYTDINNTLRAIWASGDASRIGIQSLPYMADNPRRAGQSLAVAYRTLNDPSALGSFLESFDAARYGTETPTSTEWIRRGLAITGQSGTDTDIGGIAGKIERLPIVGQTLQKTSRLFSEGGNADRITMADMLYEQYSKGGDNLLNHIGVPFGAKRDQVLDSIVAAVNRSTGHAEKGVGGDLGQTLLFAPRFFQSQLETVIKAVADKGIEGSVARRQLLKTAILGTAITYAINEARDKETVWDPRSSNFIRIRDVGGVDISLFGPWDSLVRGIVQSVPHIDEDGDFTLGDPSYLLRTKLSPALSTAVALISGETFTGSKIGLNTPEELFRQLLVPFSFREAGREPLAGVVGGLVGIKSSPLTYNEQVENMLANAGIKKSDPEYLIKRRDWLAENADKLPTKYTEEGKRSQEITKDISERRALNEQATTDGAQTLTQFRENRSLLLREQRIRRDELLGDISTKPNTKQERWLNSYFDLFDQALDPITQDVNSAKFEPLLAQWLAKNGNEAQDFINRYLGSGLGSVESAYYNDLQTLQKAGYFDLPKYQGMRSGLTDEEIDSYAQQVTSERVANPSLQSESFTATARRVLQGLSYAEIQDVINSRKEAYENPEITKLRSKYGKELLWFNPRADWDSYTNYTPGVSKGSTSLGINFKIALR